MSEPEPHEAMRSLDGIGPVTPAAMQIVKAVATLYFQPGSEMRDSLADTTHLADFWRLRIGAPGSL